MKEPSPEKSQGRKYGQVLEGARRVFLADGFEGASVDDIARAAKVSKATLYSYFPDKRILFTEVARTECNRMAEATLQKIDQTMPPREALLITAKRLVPFLLSQFAQSMFRICVAERDRFPELGQAFYASGPRMGRDRMIEYLDEAVARGELNIESTAMAAEQFSELCKAKLWIRAALGIQTKFSDSEINEVVEHAVETFMARFGT